MIKIIHNQQDIFDCGLRFIKEAVLNALKES